MERKVTHDDLMRYLDGETTPEERVWIDDSLERSTELQRGIGRIPCHAERPPGSDLRGTVWR